MYAISYGVYKKPKKVTGICFGVVYNYELKIDLKSKNYRMVENILYSVHIKFGKN